MQADRLTPAQLLRLRADILDDVHAAIPDKMPWSGNICFKLEETAHKHRQEAARREAEGKPHVCTFLCGLDGVYTCHGCGRKLINKELGRDRTGALGSTNGEREGPDSAAAADFSQWAHDEMLYLPGDPLGNAGTPVGFTLADVREVLAEAKHVLSAARLKPFLPLLKETRDGE